MTDSSQLVGVSEAAEILDVDRATITRWTRDGKLVPAQKLPGRNGPYLFTRASIAHLAAQRRTSR